MMRALLSTSALVLAAATTASAQTGIYSHAKAVTQRAVSATNAHTEAEQHPEAQTTAAKASAKQGAAQQSVSATSAAGGAKPSAQGTKASAAQGAQSGNQLNIAPADTVPPAIIMRESYDYSRDGRRDPFVSLLTTSELRPAMSDLRLTGILFDNSGSHSVATLRDVGTNELYRVTTGSPLGRMRVTAIRLKTIVFTIDEFGTTRQDSLVLGDSTKVRGK